MPLHTTSFFKKHYVWDRTVRCCHWVNVFCILILSAIGLALLNGKWLGLTTEAKILLKTIHVSVGYIFFLSLLWRIIWAFISKNPFSRFSALLPLEKDFKTKLIRYISHLAQGKYASTLGHNPLGKLMITLLLSLMLIQSASGLILAGTDLYYPPFGKTISSWIATPGNHEKIKPYSQKYINADRYAEMRHFRSPVITTHKYIFYILMVAIVLHIVAAVFMDVKEKNGLISAMFNGYKFFNQKPED